MVAMEDQTFVVKRDGSREEVAFDKISQRIKRLCTIEGQVPLSINSGELVLSIMDQFCDGISTTEIDKLVAEQCASRSTTNLAYSSLASRLTVSSLHKTTAGDFLEVTRTLANAVDSAGQIRSLLAEDYVKLVMSNGSAISEAIDYSRDYDIDYFGMKTLEKSYLLRVAGVIVERPQDMWMRVALGIHGNDITSAIESYHMMSRKLFTHATPTLFNAGTPRPQLSSCYLLGMREDSIDGIFDTLKDCALISKWAGGIGLHIHNVRATGTPICGTNGLSNGIVPMLRVYNMTARYVDQGGGKRNGSFAIYLEPWHADIELFLDMRKNHGDEESRARDLFYGLWIPDLFMRRVESGGTWHLMCPNVCPGLQDACGPQFEKLYEEYVNEGKFVKAVDARGLWMRILDSQMETGTPYMLYKDAANAKSNQQNLGTIKSSNLCTEIIEYSNAEETAVCNLASICLPSFVDTQAMNFDHSHLHAVTKIVVGNLNKVIDVNYYPTERTRRSNRLHRPIGVGVQGLADVFALLRLSFTSQKARQLNRDIFETIYHAAVEQSCELAADRAESLSRLKDEVFNAGVKDWETVFSDVYRTNPYTAEWPLPAAIGNEAIDNMMHSLMPTWDELSALFTEDGRGAGSYSSFGGSPASNGHFQFDLWNVKPSSRYNWDALRVQMKNGMRNSLLLAPMPTASTSQIMGNNECFEPFTNNVYVRRTMAGEFVLVNKHLMKELDELGLWSEEMKNQVIAASGSIQAIEDIPRAVKERYLTVWEMSMRDVIDMAADRGAFICQSQSMNLWMGNPTPQALTQMHFYAWKKGLKTGLYYLRRKPAHAAQQFTIAPPEPCLTCSS